MSKTTFFELNGNQYKVELVEANPTIYIQNNEQRLFCQVNGLPYVFGVTDYHCNFYETVIKRRLTEEWESHLICIAREKGFISGCTIKTATDMDKMKSGRLRLIGLSKLAVCGRKQIIIYDNGRWCAEAIPEVKKHWFVNDTLNIGKSLTRDEMSQVKCEPEKYNIEDLKNIICDVTFLLSQHKKYITITSNQAKLISEILNDYLK